MAEKSKIKVLGGLVSIKATLPDLQMAVFSPYPHIASPLAHMLLVFLLFFFFF